MKNRPVVSIVNPLVTPYYMPFVAELEIKDSAYCLIKLIGKWTLAIYSIFFKIQ